MLLHKDLEQTLLIKKLRTEKEQIQALQNIVEMANWQPDIISVLRMMANELLTILDFQVALIGEQTLSGSKLLDVIHVNDAGGGLRRILDKKIRCGNCLKMATQYLFRIHCRKINGKVIHF